MYLLVLSTFCWTLRNRMSRVDLKICLLTCMTLCEKLPIYHNSMLAPSLPFYSLRSNKGITLSVSRVKTNTGARSFQSCAVSLWNNLQMSVRPATSNAIFTKHLKTHLFDLAPPPSHLHAQWPVDVT